MTTLNIYEYDGTTLVHSIPHYDIIDPRIFERLNGEYTFDFTLHDDSLTGLIFNGYIVSVDGDYFIITQMQIQRGTTFAVKYSCEHISYQLNFHNAESDELDAEITYTGTVYSIIPQMLAGTNFAFIYSDDTPDQVTFTTKKRGIRTRILEFCVQLGYEAHFRGYEVAIQNRRGWNRGLEIMLGKNIMSLTETRLLNFNGTEETNFNIDFIDLNYVTDLDGNSLADEECHMGDTVKIYSDYLTYIEKRVVAKEYNPFEMALPKIEIGDNALARDLAQQMMKKSTGGGSGGLEILGTNDLLTVYKNDIQKGQLVTVRRTMDIGVPLKVENPTVLPADIGLSTDISVDGNYLAFGSLSAPYLLIYKRNNDVFTKLPNPTTMPTSRVNGVTFSTDGNYLAVVQEYDSRLIIYKRDGDAFTRLPDPIGGIPSSAARGVCFSSDGVYLVAVGNFGMAIFKRSGESFTRISNPSPLPTGTGFSVSFSNDDVYLVVGHSSSPRITIYKREDDTFTKLNNPSSLPTDDVNGVSFAGNGDYLAVAQWAPPYLILYKRNGDTFTRLPNPSAMPTGYGKGVSFTRDGNYLAVAHYTSPFLTIYKRNGDTFTKIDNPAILPTGNGFGVSMRSSQPYFAVAHETSPYVTIYKTDVAGDYAYTYGGVTDINRDNFFAVAVAMEDGQTNDISKRVTTIPIA